MATGKVLQGSGYRGQRRVGRGPAAAAGIAMMAAARRWDSDALMALTTLKNYGERVSHTS